MLNYIIKLLVIKHCRQDFHNYIGTYAILNDMSSQKSLQAQQSCKVGMCCAAIVISATGHGVLKKTMKAQ